MKVGPTERIGLSAAGPGGAGAGDADGDAGGDASGAGAPGAPAAVLGAPFFAVAGAPFAAGGRAIFFALSSVTMMSPCCSAAVLSSMLFRASDQVWPAALQAQDGLNS